MKESPKIGIVTVLYNSEKVLEDFFNSLEYQSYKNFDLFIVNNNSPDDSFEVSKKLAKKVHFKVHFIECEENYGVAKGNNLGIYSALNNKCDFVLLSNNDIELNSESISTLLDGIQNENATMAVPKIYFHGTNLIWAAGGKYVYRTGGVRHIGLREEDRHQHDEIKVIEYAPTCFMLIQSSVFSRIGFMDERYFVYYDDTDFVFRAVSKNKEKLVYIPASLVWHKESTSTGGRKNDFTVKYLNRNMVYFVLKHYTFFHQLVVFNFNLFYYLIKVNMTMSKHQKKLIKAAYIEGYKMYRDYNRELASNSNLKINRSF